MPSISFFRSLKQKTSTNTEDRNGKNVMAGDSGTVGAGVGEVYGLTFGVGEGVLEESRDGWTTTHTPVTGKES